MCEPPPTIEGSNIPLLTPEPENEPPAGVPLKVIGAPCSQRGATELILTSGSKFANAKAGNVKSAHAGVVMVL